MRSFVVYRCSGGVSREATTVFLAIASWNARWRNVSAHTPLRLSGARNLRFSGLKSASRRNYVTRVGCEGGDGIFYSCENGVQNRNKRVYEIISLLLAIVRFSLSSAAKFVILKCIASFGDLYLCSAKRFLVERHFIVLYI